MTRPSILAVAVAVLTGVPGRAVDLPIQKYVERLGSKSYADRERATKALRRYGPVALPEVRKAVKSADEEVRFRAEGLARELEVRAALEPKKVTLAGEGRPLSAVLADFQAQTGYRVRALGTATQQPVAIDLNRVPFWNALEQLGEKTGHAVTLDTYGSELRFMQARVRPPYVQVAGPFRVEATRLHEDRDAVFRDPKPDGAPGATTHTLTLTLAVHAEPRLTLISVGSPQVDTATDEAARAYTVVKQPAPGREYYSGYESENMPLNRQTQVRLQRAVDKATTIAQLAGTIPVKVVIEKKRVVVSEKPAGASGTRIRTGTGELEITQATEENGGAMFTLEVKVPVDANGMPNMQWTNRIKLEDANGNAFPSYSSGSRSTGREYWMRKGYQLNAGGKFGAPAKIVFEDWVTIDHAIPFTFKGIALP
ncbi:MAG TPA: hypothetical protein VM597_16735 [Gemmataceae bacterium]|jgi:hypothetical protein|nr:hypothetical protein [Gemmataceae bacterium]